MHDVVIAPRTAQRHIAVACELAPIFAAMLGIGALAFVAYAPSFLDNPPDVVVVPMLFLAAGCFLTFGLSGLGWIYVGETRTGAAILSVRVVALFALLFLFGRRWQADGTDAYDNYAAPYYLLTAFAVLTPLLSTAALALKLLSTRPTRPTRRP